ncbi:hypothetical protein CCR75_008592 [Bremia lactucae]|uniref:Uncharacterized protein n=1 Tax=Bremia lactucae TaxID=4779 RepID=A0A976FLF4_BRELC|nr:hypothetical protein CCR75_003590 [Bremia lactucae]TDH71412.1 hypothetical protein CCR75_008592 [Bremia lactucae]
MTDIAALLVPPQDIHPNNAVFATQSLPRPLTWQRREHMMHRRTILTRIGQLLVRKTHRVLSEPNCATSTGGVDVHKTWIVARKLEVLMFLQSASLLEYINMDSLTRRVQALTARIVNKKIRRATTISSPASATTEGPLNTNHVVASACCAPSLSPVRHRAPPNWHKRSIVYGVDSGKVSKRHRVLSLPNDELWLKNIEFQALGSLLFCGYEELNRIIWSFVDGVQIMRLRSVCRSAKVLTPLFVTSLQLSCNAVQQALATRIDGNACILRECIHLRHLEIVSLAAGMTFGKLSMRATNCPQRFVVTHDDHEQIVLSLAEQMRLNTFVGLSRLSHTCLFTNEEANGEADVLLNTLMLGCCPNIEELCLPGNSFGDYGATKVAELLWSQVCPKLTRLDLRRNFIGEDGIRILCHALADGCAPNLAELCLGGNTITDSSFHHILFAMESRQMRCLRFLGVEMNYLTAKSMEMLGRTVGKLVCPALTQISYSDNSVDNDAAKRLLTTAIYRERVLRASKESNFICDSITSEDESSSNEPLLSDEGV